MSSLQGTCPEIMYEGLVLTDPGESTAYRARELADLSTTDMNGIPFGSKKDTEVFR